MASERPTIESLLFNFITRKEPAAPRVVATLARRASSDSLEEPLVHLLGHIAWMQQRLDERDARLAELSHAAYRAGDPSVSEVIRHRREDAAMRNACACSIRVYRLGRGAARGALTGGA